MTGEPPRRILFVHNAYRQRGGEDAVVEAEAELLRGAGVDVRLACFDNAAISGVAGKVSAFRKAGGDNAVARDLVAKARDHCADLVHIHNFWPLVTPAAHIALAEAGFPVVQTLHNYRLLCANAMLLRNGEPCRDCLDRLRLSALRHRCYRGSLTGSAAVLRMQNATLRDPRWVASVTRFVTLSEFARDLFVGEGLPAERVVVKGNAVSDPGPPEAGAIRQGLLFVGRLSPEKGVDLLCEAARAHPDLPITVLGEGPDRALLEGMAAANVRFAGTATPEQVRTAMRAARWLILPSRWYEGFPMVLAEAFANGLPAIAARIGGLPEIVRDGQTGLLFEPNSVASLAEALARTHDDKLTSRLGAGARSAYELHYSETANLAALQSIYAAAMAEAAA
ncbi:glycosyltransferase [Altererythrobacter sp. CAU 1778]